MRPGKTANRSVNVCRKKNAPDEKPIFQCIAMLASALGPSMTKFMHEVLDLMFQWGLTEQLRQALVVIARHIPPLLESIQGKLKRERLRYSQLITNILGRPTAQPTVDDTEWQALQTTGRTSPLQRRARQPECAAGQSLSLPCTESLLTSLSRLFLFQDTALRR